MSSGQWEVVGKNKKDKLANKKPGQVDKRKIVATKVEDILPVSQMKNIYSSIGKTSKENKKPQEAAAVNKPETAKKQQAAKKNAQVPKPKPPKTIESAFSLVNIEDFQSSYETSKQRFPETPLVWLKEITAFLNTHIAPELNDPVFLTKPNTYPWDIVPAKIQQTIENAIEQSGPQTTQIFYDFLLTAMANDMNKNQPAVGYKILLQYLSERDPKLPLVNLDKHINLRTSYKNSPKICLSVLWALKQAGLRDFNTGLKLFKVYLAPLFDLKHYTRFIVTYLLDLFKLNERISLSKEDYTFLFDLIHAKHSLSGEITRDLNQLNKKLTSLMNGSTDAVQSNAYFELFLVKLYKTETTSYKADVCETLMQCLQNDPKSYSIWRKVYSKNIQQSVVLLKFIKDHWKKVSGRLQKKEFQTLLKQFTATNLELTAKPKKDADLQESVRICKVVHGHAQSAPDVLNE